MNLFKTTDNGGLPLVLNDFRWIDAGYREAFKAIMSSYGITDSMTVILSGCERNVASGTVTISEGYVSIGGEICFVPEHSYAEPVGTLEYWDLNLSFDAEGYKTFQSTSNFDTYQKRIAKITVASSIPTGYTEYDDTENIFQIIRRKINTDSWHTFLNTVIDMSGVVPGTYISRYKKDSSNFIHFDGRIYTEDIGVGPVDYLIETLPVGYRPATEKVFILSLYDNDAGGALRFVSGVIKTNGEVRIKSMDGLYVYILDMSQITPFEAVV